MINYVFNAILVTKEETSRLMLCRKGLRVFEFVFVEIALCAAIELTPSISASFEIHGKS